jgi:spoIIIJ-associated protein
MGFEDATLSHTKEDGSIIVKISGDIAGVSIGRRGETLMRFNTWRLAANAWRRICPRRLDSGITGKAQKNLGTTGEKACQHAIKTGRSTKLEPMNPYERRVIPFRHCRYGGCHLCFGGEEPNRCDRYQHHCAPGSARGY